MKKQLITSIAMAVAFLPLLSAQDSVTTVDSVQYKVLLSPSHESPPIPGVDVSGEATIEFNITRTGGEISSAVVDFHVNWRAGQDEQLVAMHIHRGAAGVNGGVLINAGLGPQTAAQGGTIFRSATVDTPAGIAILQEIMANPSGFYLNAHSASSPAGIIRGQLQMDTEAQLAKVQADLQKAIDDVDAIVRVLANFPPKR